jgi:hypothetical protein
MIGSEYSALLAGYITALACWLLIARLSPSLWPSPPRAVFQHPWREVGWALLSVLVVLGVGQLYTAKLLFPTTGRGGVPLETLNQVLIFLPLPLLLVVRRQPLSTAWLPTTRVWLRLFTGLGLGLISILVYTLSRAGSDSWLAVISRTYHPGNLPHLAQVFLEDMGIAILFVRLGSALGWRRTVLIVAALFSLAHVPAMLSGGGTVGSLGHLVLDVGLAVGILCVLQRSGDIWWFWMVHFAMDMMQFYSVPGRASSAFSP